MPLCLFVIPKQVGGRFTVFPCVGLHIFAGKGIVKLESKSSFARQEKRENTRRLEKETPMKRPLMIVSSLVALSLTLTYALARQDAMVDQNVSLDLRTLPPQF